MFRISAALTLMLLTAGAAQATKPAVVTRVERKLAVQDYKSWRRGNNVGRTARPGLKRLATVFATAIVPAVADPFVGGALGLMTSAMLIKEVDIPVWDHSSRDLRTVTVARGVLGGAKVTDEQVDKWHDAGVIDKRVLGKLLTMKREAGETVSAERDLRMAKNAR